jgi:hypothetical protein
MTIKGKLETFYLTSILQLMDSDQKTGVLRLTNGKDDVRIYMNEGTIVYATSSQEKFSLGNILRRKGILSEQELKNSLKEAKQCNQKLGTYLVEKGYISNEVLKSTLHVQVKEILYNLFLWRTGEFVYEDVLLDVEGKLVTQMNTMEIVLEATRRIDEWSVIRKMIPNDQLIFRISESGVASERVSKNEWRILSLINGRRTLEELIKESGYSEFAVFKIAYSLILSGLIEKVDPKDRSRTGSIDYSGITTIYNDVLEVIHKDLETDLGKRVSTLIDECKAELVYKQRSVLKGFDLTQQFTSNLQGILEGMASFKGHEEGRMFLIHSFNSLLEAIFEKEMALLGSKITIRTVTEAEKTLSYIKEYQKNAGDKIKVVYSIENILSRVRERVGPKR